MSYINKKGELKSKKKTLNMNEGVPLNSRHLKKFNSNSCKYMKHLKYNNDEQIYLFRHSKYEVGKKSISYYYKEKYPKLKFIECESNTLVKAMYEDTWKYQKERNGSFGNFKLNNTEYLLSDYDSIAIDLVAVKKFLDDKLDDYLEKCTNDPTYENKKNNFDYDSYVRDFVSACEINNRYFSFIRTIEGSDGRLHSQFQRASKNIRPFLKINGEYIWEVDISASVPTIFCSQLEDLKQAVEKALNQRRFSVRISKPSGGGRREERFKYRC